MELVSVIVPVYNSEHFLERCLDSILNQTYKNIEVLLINDGSTDSSGEICETFKNKDRRVRVIHQKNAGVSSSRNIGIDMSEGKYIQFVDSDDYIEPKMIEILTREIEKKVELAICGYKIENIDDNGNSTFTESKNYNEYRINKDIFLKSFGLYFQDYYINYIWNKLYIASLIKNYNLYFDTQIDWGEDLIFNLEYLDICSKITITGNKLYNYVKYNEDSITSKFNKNLYCNQQSMYTKVRKFLKDNDSYSKINKDVVENRFTNMVIASINNLYHKNSTYNRTEIKKEISNIIRSNMVQKNIKYFNGDGIQKKLIGYMIKAKQDNLISYYFYTIKYIKTKMKPLYNLLLEVNRHTR